MSAAASPLTNFSGCHVGIIKNFKRLAELPTLLADPSQAKAARESAAQLQHFFQAVVLQHHAEEEEELFHAVKTALGADPAELAVAKQQIVQLTAEHRQLEKLWHTLESDIKRIAKGKAAQLDTQTAQTLSEAYLAHAHFEEEQFLPLAERILSHNGMSALGLSLHLRNHDKYIPVYI